MITKSRKELCELLKINDGRLRFLFKRKNIKKPLNVGTIRRPVYKLTVKILIKLLKENEALDKEIVSRETLLRDGSGFINFLKKTVNKLKD